MKLNIFTSAVLVTATSLTLLHEALTVLPVQAENLQHIQQLLSTKQCPQCDLSGAGLVLANLEGANLSGANLSRANLSRTNLMGADLTGANLSGASLNGANLSGANLSGANLIGTDLRDAFLANAQLFGVDLRNTLVQGAIGIPQYAGTAEDFYAWGVVEAQRGNHKAAIVHYNQSLSLKPDFAPVFLARAMSRFRSGDEAGATQDAQTAKQLFTEQGNTTGAETSQNLIQSIEIAQKPPETRGGSSLGSTLLGIGSLLLRFLSPF